MQEEQNGQAEIIRSLPSTSEPRSEVHDPSHLIIIPFTDKKLAVHTIGERSSMSRSITKALALRCIQEGLAHISGGGTEYVELVNGENIKQTAERLGIRHASS